MELAFKFEKLIGQFHEKVFAYLTTNFKWNIIIRVKIIMWCHRNIIDKGEVLVYYKFDEAIKNKVCSFLWPLYTMKLLNTLSGGS